MAAIQRRGNSFRIKVSCGYDARGKQVVQSMTWKPDEGMTEKQIEKEVQRQAVLFEEACLKGNVVATIKFEDFACQWFKEYAEIRLKQRTVEGYHQMEKRIYKAIGHIRLDKLTTRHIQKFIIDLCNAEREDGRDYNGGRLSTKTIKLYKSMISTICDYAVKMQMIQTNPCKNVTIPKVITPEKEYYSIEEAQRLLDLFKQEDEKNYASPFLGGTLWAATVQICSAQVQLTRAGANPIRPQELSQRLTRLSRLWTSSQSTTTASTTETSHPNTSHLPRQMQSLTR